MIMSSKNLLCVILEILYLHHDCLHCARSTDQLSPSLSVSLRLIRVINGRSISLRLPVCDSDLQQCWPAWPCCRELVKLLFQISSWYYECQPDGVVTDSKHSWSCCCRRRAAADVLLALWRCCWPGGYAAGPADVVRAQRMCGGHDELECAASPVNVLLALRGRCAAVPGQSHGRIRRQSP